MAGARPPDAAAARRFCALPRDLQGSAGRTREGPCGGCGRAGGSAGANGHGPPPMAAFAAARAHGRAFASFLCTIAAGVRRRDGPALLHSTSPGRAFAAFLCTAAAACAVPAAAVRGGGTGRRFFTPHPPAARSQRSCARSPQACGGGGTGWRFLTPHPMAARSQRSCARPPRRAQFRPRPCAAEGRAGASPPHIPRPRVCSVPVHGRRGVRSSGRGRSRRSNSYRARGGFAPTAAVRRRRAPLRSRSAPRAGRGPRGRSGRRPRSAGRWGGAGRASR